MTSRLKAPAFTLIEMIIAITVFSIFIGFAVSAFLSFHRADEEALVDRSLVMEGGQVMDTLTTDIKANKIDYEYYDESSGGSAFTSAFTSSFSSGDHVWNKSILALRSPDGLTRTVYEWDSEAKTLTVQKFDMTDPLNVLTAAGYTEALPMTSDHVYLNDVNFRIFPDVDPYDAANASDDSTAFQPVVTMNLTFAAEGRVRDEVTLPLQTTVTSRFYQ
jgi:prepilin-type N-terminal cleavage/methylation domain-containing protein